MNTDKNKIIAIREQKVKKANQLIQKSKFDLTAQQQKIILYLISKIQPTDKNFQEYSFDIYEFCQVCGINYTSNFEEIKNNIQKVADKSLWVKIDYINSLIRWIEKAEIDERNKRIIIRLDERLKPFLLELKSNYTQYSLIYPLTFKHKYTIRLYEWICSIHYDKTEEYIFTIPLDELKKVMGAEGVYPKYTHFKERALLPALKEIKEKSDKNISCGEYRNPKGKVTAIEFEISQKNLSEKVKVDIDITKNLSVYMGKYTTIEF